MIGTKLTRHQKITVETKLTQHQNVRNQINTIKKLQTKSKYGVKNKDQICSLLIFV